MSRSAALSVSRVRYSVRNCWSTEMPNRYSLVAPSGIPRVTTVNAARNTDAPIRATWGQIPRRRRHSSAMMTKPTRQLTCPTVVSACSWFDDGNAGHSTREIASSATTETMTATKPASAI